MRPATDATFFDGRCAEVCIKADGAVVGTFGTVHEVIGIDLDCPSSAIDVDLSTSSRECSSRGGAVAIRIQHFK